MNARSPSKKTVSFTNALVTILLIGLIMQILIVLQLEISFDEFYTYNRSFEFARGEVDNPLQTLLLRIVSWAHFLPGNEIDQIIGTRLMMFGFGLVTCFCIYKTARRYTSVVAALYAVFCYIGFYPVFLNLTSIRVDGTVTMLLMMAVYLVSDPKVNWPKIIAIGILIGLALMVTLKSIFYTPIIAGFLVGRWARSNWSMHYFMQGVIAGGVAVLSFCTIYYFHSPATLDANASADYMNSMASKSLFSDGFFQNPSVIFHGIFVSPLWIFILLGSASLIWQMMKSKQKSTHIEKLLFIFPITTVFFYIHAYPYFYVVIMAPGVILAALAFDKYFSKDRALLFAVLIAIQFVLMTTVFAKAMSKPQDYQRQIVNLVHEIFPEPVTYIDYCGMVPSHNRVVEGGVFISPDSFDMKDYFNNDPIMEGLLRKHQPKYLLANASSLDFANEFTHPFNIDLQAADVETLKSHYVRFWGPIYLPGKVLSNIAGNGDPEFEIIIEGEYTLKSTSPISLNAEILIPDQTVYLKSGLHTLSGDISEGAQLIWGNNLSAPEESKIPDAIFFGF